MLWFVQQSFVLLGLAWALGALCGWLVFGRRRGWAEPVTDVIPVVDGQGADGVTWVPAEWVQPPEHHDYADPVWAAEAGLTDDDLRGLSTGPEQRRPEQNRPDQNRPEPVRPEQPWPAPRPAGTDDLTRIDGVTPRIAEALRAAGLVGFGDVARAGIDDLRSALDNAGLAPTFKCAYWPLMANDLDLDAGLDTGLDTAAPSPAPTAEAPTVDVPEGTREVAPEVAPEVSASAEVAPATIDVTAPAVEVPEVTVDVTTPTIDVTRPAPGPLLDEFERIEGVSLAAARALRSAGLTTFTDIAEAPHGRLRGALSAAGVRITPSLSTWGVQARRLAASDEGAARAAARAAVGSTAHPAAHPAAYPTGTAARL